MNKIEVINEIQSFLEGKNDELKYIVNVETSYDSNEAKCIIHEPECEPRIEKHKFTPFLYVKDLEKLGYNLFNGNKDKEEAIRIKNGITIERMKTGNHSRLKNGYPYKVTTTKTYDHILKYYEEGGLAPYGKAFDDNGNLLLDKNKNPIFKNRSLFYMIKTDDQFFISTGARLFKGIEEYKDLHRLTFDIETTGLRYEHSRVFSIGIKDNRGYEETIEVIKPDDDQAEKEIIEKFFNIIIEKKSAVIAGYNSEMFDFDFLLGRLKIIDKDLKEEEKLLSQIQTTLDNNSEVNKRKKLKRKDSTVKFGNSTENYTSTQMWGFTVLDILHAVKKTAAINTDIKNNKLKYICKFEDIAKPNRMYIDDGSNIYKYWIENKIFIINPENNKYLQIPDEFQETGRNLLDLQNIKNVLSEEKYNKIRKLLLSDEKKFINWTKENSSKILNENKKFIFINGKKIVDRYLLDDLWETEQVDNLYNQSSFLLAKIVPTTYGRAATMGNAAIWNLLMTAWSYENDLAIPHTDEIEVFSGGLARCYKKGYTKRLVKIDYASLYPFIQLTEDVFPIFDITGVIKKMLLYMTTTRNIYKKLANGNNLNQEEVTLLKTTDEDTYNKIINKHEFTKEERNLFKVKQLPIKIINNSLFGALGSGFAFNWSDNICAARITCTGRLWLRKAISWFKNFKCEPLLAVTDGVNFSIPDTTKIKVTNNGMYKEENEGLIEEMWIYNNKKGINALIEKYNDDVKKSYQESNPDKECYISLDNDGEFVSCLNLSRINYALLVEKKNKKTNKLERKIKFTGNTIKSKTMPEFIEDFIDEAMHLILEGKGKEFVEYYYEYSDKIFYKQIPLKKIASKSKYKIKINDYINRGIDKNGREKAKQAHMELVLEERKIIAEKLFNEHIVSKNLNEKPIEEYTNKEKYDKIKSYMPPEPELDSMVYYVNIGTRKSHGDVKTTNNKAELYTEFRKMKNIKSDITISKLRDYNVNLHEEFNKYYEENKIEETKILAKLINQKDIEDNPNLTGEYNVDKYLDAFNKRVKVLVEGFSDNVKEKLFVEIKRSKIKDTNGNSIENKELIRNYFVNEELILKNFDQDDFKESMFLEEKEVEFWNRTGYDPRLIWNGFKEYENDKIHYEIYEHALNFVSDGMIKINQPKVKSVNDEIQKGDFVLVKNYNKYDLGFHNGKFIEIKKENLNIPKSKLELEFEKKQKEENNKLEKLKIDDDNSIDLEVKKIVESNNKKLKFLEKFNKKFQSIFKLDRPLTLDEVMSQENIKKVFENFIIENNESNNVYEYMGVDDD